MADGGIRVSPLSSGTPGSSRGARPRLGGGGMAINSQRILAVDDDLTVQEITTFFLGDASEVKPATTGADALAKLRREPIDLVVLDHRLPDLTGLGVLTGLRS